jgi:outer membrane protein insertion porin family
MRISIARAVIALWSGPAFAQATVAPAPIAPAAPATSTPAEAASGTISVCNGAYQIGPPANLPPAGSGPVVYILAPCWARQGGVPLVDPETYLYYIQTQPSLPSRNEWKPYTRQAEQSLMEDFKRLWATNFLDDLKIETVDYTFSNGVVGKIILYDMEERQRIKNTVYNDGTKEIEQAKVEERLRELGITIRLDSFVDQATEKRVANVVREMLVEKGFQEAKVEPVHETLPGGPKLVALKFKVTEGPKVKVSNVDFVGNKIFGDGKLRGRMKRTKAAASGFSWGASIRKTNSKKTRSRRRFYRDRVPAGDVGHPISSPS